VVKPPSRAMARRLAPSMPWSLCVTWSTQVVMPQGHEALAYNNITIVMITINMLSKEAFRNP
jgi:hypothetical protein